MVEIQSLLFYAKSAKMWLEMYPKNFIQFGWQIKKLAFLGGDSTLLYQITVMDWITVTEGNLAKKY